MSRQFDIEDDVVALFSEMAKPKPFESFGDALRRFLTELKGANGKTQQRTVEELFAELDALPGKDRQTFDRDYEESKRRRAPSPDSQSWASGVEELAAVRGLNTWRKICERFNVEVGADSARRALQKWARTHRPDWPPIPEA